MQCCSLFLLQSSQVQPQSPHVPLEIASQANESQEEEQEEQSQSQGDLGLLMHRVGMGVTARPSAQRPRSAPLLEGTPSTSESERVGPSSIAAHPRRHSAPDHQESDYSAPGPQNGMSQNTSTSRRILDTAVHQFEGQAPDMYSPPSKRRKQDPTEEALRVLHSIANRRHETRPVDPEVAENEHFFKMMAYKVSKLPTDVQESLRFQMHKLVYEEQRKLSQ
ncbi:hypothetical protein BaRGS_00023579 [Batillaria attramentaria]|uniref:BESS domain-containing protein n=1 Tax=Batillaria attramentaria TaxID=370345 RepID=A0ABD0KDH2_9CAEN